MEPRAKTLAQIFLRISLSMSFLSAVADRFGWWGEPGTPSVNWGNWSNFLMYSNQVNALFGEKFGLLLAIVATTLEIILPVFLLVGYRIKQTSLASGVLLLAFALSMTFSFSIKAPLDYSVFTGAAASFLLAYSGRYRYSFDEALRPAK